MARLRATQLAVGFSAGPFPVAVYTVPAGYRALLKWFSMLNVAGPRVLQLLTASASGVLLSSSQPAYPSYWAQPCWMVFNPGDVISVGASAGGTIVWQLNGSLLTI